MVALAPPSISLLPLGLTRQQTASDYSSDDEDDVEADSDFGYHTSPSFSSQVAFHLSNIMNIFRQRRYRNIFATACFLFLVYLLWPSDSYSFDFHLPGGGTSESEWADRAEQVRGAFLHAYQSYEQYSWGNDELLPISKGSINNFNGWGLTVYDALDTLYLMNFTSEFSRAVDLISKRKDYNLAPEKYAPFFETTIRYMGSLLATYALTSEPILLAAADKLGESLLPAFDTESGLPMWGVNTMTGRLGDGPNTHEKNRTLLAEIGSCQMEFKYLSKLTGKKKYFQKVDHIMNVLAETQRPSFGLWPTYWNSSTGTSLNHHYSIGAWADSTYEYLLKQYLMTNRSEKRLLDMFKTSMNGVIDNLLFLSPTRHLLYVTDIGSPSPLAGPSSRPSRRFEHLSCFLPGLLALGAETLSKVELSSHDREKWRWAAEGLAWSCSVMYEDQPTGLGPEEVLVDYYAVTTDRGVERLSADGRWREAYQTWERTGRPGGKPPGVAQLPSPIRQYGRFYNLKSRDYRVAQNTYLLRPETIESIYIMYRTTGDSKWRERGWDIFRALETYTRRPVGYSSIKEVNGIPTVLDSMPSYALAETWKYLYLLFLGKERDLLPMDKWVFNTEAHPFPIFDWTVEEKVLYGLD